MNNNIRVIGGDLESLKDFESILILGKDYNSLFKNQREYIDKATWKKINDGIYTLKGFDFGVGN